MKTVKKPIDPPRKATPSREPIIVTNPNDTRLKAYSDSLALYKNYKKPPLGYVPITESDSPTAKEYVKKNTINQLKNLYYSPTGSITGNESIAYYDPPPKKPVQPVVLVKEATKANVSTKELSMPKSSIKVQRTVKLPSAIRDIKYDTQKGTVLLDLDGTNRAMPRKDFDTWVNKPENRKMFDDYRRVKAKK